jgi:D-alanine-D-alanine ligase
MKPDQKIRVAVIFGGKSGEHDVSLRSAASVLKHLDRERFEVVPVGIDRKGYWRQGAVEVEKQNGSDALVFAGEPSQAALLPSSKGELSQGALLGRVDVVFPVVHGPLCEDGTLQGLLELADIPYVGSGVLASALAMDKDVAKRLAQFEGISVVPGEVIREEVWKKSQKQVLEGLEERLGFPCFVKPCRMGSSVGVHKGKDRKTLTKALEDAFRYDSKVLIEKAILAREIEISVMENQADFTDPLVSLPGEVISSHEFYSYEAKYLDENGASLMIPAQLSESQIQEAQALAKKAFRTFECEGLARVDLFIDKSSGKMYLNEINTLPGFTSISMYPKLWEASGIPYSELLTRLINLALQRYSKQSKLLRERVDERLD